MHAPIVGLSKQIQAYGNWEGPQRKVAGPGREDGAPRSTDFQISPIEKKT